MNTKLFLYLDILGFRNLILDSGRADWLFEQLDEASMHRDSNFKTIVFSDTLITFHLHSNLEPHSKSIEVMCLIEHVQGLIRRLAGSGIAFRAIITEGPFSLKALTNFQSYYGGAMIEAYDAEKKIKATGLFIRADIPTNLVYQRRSFDPEFDFVFTAQDLTFLEEECPEVDNHQGMLFAFSPFTGDDVFQFESLYAEILHLKEVHEGLHGDFPSDVRFKFYCTWDLYAKQYPKITKHLVSNGFDPHSIMPYDWDAIAGELKGGLPDRHPLF